MRSWYNPREDEWVDFEPIQPEQVYEAENPVIGMLLDASGGVLVEIHERPVRRIGFQSNGNG